MADRPSLFLELTNSICAHCLRKIEAKIVLQDGRVYLHKLCPQHGAQRTLVSTNLDWYQKTRSFVKPGQMPKRFNTPVKYGCPYDCGLCPDHEQHSCLAIVEVTDHCNLACPICYAESGPHRPDHRSLGQIAFMLDSVVRNEGQPDIVQISGGEPTLHPEFFKILEMARERPIKHLMVNTNGLRIAREADFAKRLQEFMPAFELYLQFDSLHDDALRHLRGADLSRIRRDALDRLNDLGISTTLVVTLQKGVNDAQIGEILDFAVQQPCVRGVTFQPVQTAGRTEGFDPSTDRLTVSEVRDEIVRQSSLFAADDIIPVPCHPDCLAMAYALKVGGATIPLTGLIDPQTLLEAEGSTIVYERNPGLRQRVFEAFSTSHGPASAGLALKHLLCCLPGVECPDTVTYENVFRIIIMQFLDPWSFDVRSVKRSCVHIVHPDGRLIPFDNYNIFYRDGREKILEELRTGHAGHLAPLTVRGRQQRPAISAEHALP